jgi:hypothetical protein
MLLALEERHHEMLAVPHRDDRRQIRAHPRVNVRRFDAELAGVPDQAQIFGGRHADRALHPWKIHQTPERHQSAAGVSFEPPGGGVITTETAICRDLTNDSGVFSNPRQVKTPDGERRRDPAMRRIMPSDRRLIPL